jgi:hypothetical protein
MTKLNCFFHSIANIPLIVTSAMMGDVPDGAGEVLPKPANINADESGQRQELEYQLQDFE